MGTRRSNRASCSRRVEEKVPILQPPGLASIRHLWVFAHDESSLIGDVGRVTSGDSQCAVVPVHNGSTAARDLKSRPPAAILIDADLPGADLSSFLSMIRQVQDRRVPLFVVHDGTADCFPLEVARWIGILDIRSISRSVVRSEFLDRLRHDREESAGGVTRKAPETRTLAGRTVKMATRVPLLFDMFDDLELAAAHDLTVLLLGETGTGKTTLARLFHEISPRSRSKFTNVACGALLPQLIESELFGHVQGAFTGADRSKIGKFEAAGNGSLLLDEIDTLSIEQQAKLLKVIESGEFEPVGSNDTRMTKARLIVASNVCLEKLVEHGRFRQDLFYRLSVLVFRLPPLRERVADIVPIALEFIENFSDKCGTPIRYVHAEFLDSLKAYHWPGNLRELRNCVERAVVLCRDGHLTSHCLPPAIAAGLRARSSQWSGPLAPAPSTAIGTLGDTVAQSEQRVIEEALRRHNNKRTAAAKELGISRVTLYNKMRRYGLM